MRNTLFLFILFTTQLFAQEYTPDQIIINGTTYNYNFHHMEYYFKYNSMKRPSVNKDTTALNRNYVALFALENNKMYLKDLKIKSKFSDKKYTKSVITKIINNDNERFLNWISGLFYVGLGEALEKQTDTLHIDYPNYIVFELKKGNVTRSDQFTLAQFKVFKNYQFERYIRTIEYKKTYQYLKDNTTMTDFEIEGHIRKNIIFYSRKNMLKDK